MDQLSQAYKPGDKSADNNVSNQARTSDGPERRSLKPEKSFNLLDCIVSSLSKPFTNQVPFKTLMYIKVKFFSVTT